MARKANKNESSKRRTKSTRSGNSSISPYARIPARYPRAAGDTTVIPFRFTGLLHIPAGSATIGQLWVLGKGDSGSGYIFLDDMCAAFSALSDIYTRWMLTDLKVQLRATGVGGNANTFIAASYIPSNSTVDSVPTELYEVSQAMHYTESALGTIGNLSVNPTDYFNDWRQLADSDNSDAQCGLIQLYGSGATGSSGVTAGVITVSGVLHFCGLRSNS